MNSKVVRVVPLMQLLLLLSLLQEIVIESSARFHYEQHPRTELEDDSVVPSHPPNHHLQHTGDRVWGKESNHVHNRKRHYPQSHPQYHLTRRKKASREIEVESDSSFLPIEPSSVSTSSPNDSFLQKGDKSESSHSEMMMSPINHSIHDNKSSEVSYPYFSSTATTSADSTISATTLTRDRVHHQVHHYLHRNLSESASLDTRQNGDAYNSIISNRSQIMKYPTESSSLKHRQYNIIPPNHSAVSPQHQQRPSNISLTVVQWSPPAVRVSWDFNQSEHGVDLHTKMIPKKLEAFRITYHPIYSKYRMIQEVSPSARNLTLDRLRPNTEYLLKIYPVFQNEQMGEASHSIRFISPDDEHSRNVMVRKSHRPLLMKMNQGLNRQSKIDSTGTQLEPIDDYYTVKTEEVVIVLVIISIWMTFILLFIKKWGKIRTLEPRFFFPKDLLDSRSNDARGTTTTTNDPLHRMRSNSGERSNTPAALNATVSGSCVGNNSPPLHSVVTVAPSSTRGTMSMLAERDSCPLLLSYGRLHSRTCACHFANTSSSGGQYIGNNNNVRNGCSSGTEQIINHTSIPWRFKEGTSGHHYSALPDSSFRVNGVPSKESSTSSYYLNLWKKSLSKLNGSTVCFTSNTNNNYNNCVSSIDDNNEYFGSSFKEKLEEGGQRSSKNGLKDVGFEREGNIQDERENAKKTTKDGKEDAMQSSKERRRRKNLLVVLRNEGLQKGNKRKGLQLNLFHPSLSFSGVGSKGINTLLYDSEDPDSIFDAESKQRRREDKIKGQYTRMTCQEDEQHKCKDKGEDAKTTSRTFKRTNTCRSSQAKKQLDKEAFEGDIPDADDRDVVDDDDDYEEEDDCVSSDCYDANDDDEDEQEETTTEEEEEIYEVGRLCRSADDLRSSSLFLRTREEGQDRNEKDQRIPDRDHYHPSSSHAIHSHRSFVMPDTADAVAPSSSHSPSTHSLLHHHHHNHQETMEKSESDKPFNSFHDRTRQEVRNLVKNEVPLSSATPASSSSVRDRNNDPHHDGGSTHSLVCSELTPSSSSLKHSSSSNKEGDDNEPLHTKRYKHSPQHQQPIVTMMKTTVKLLEK